MKELSNEERQRLIEQQGKELIALKQDIQIQAAHINTLIQMNNLKNSALANQAQTITFMENMIKSKWDYLTQQEKENFQHHAKTSTKMMNKIMNDHQVLKKKIQPIEDRSKPKPKKTIGSSIIHKGRGLMKSIGNIRTQPNEDEIRPINEPNPKP